MIFHSPILAMLLASLISSAAMIWAAAFSLDVARNWDINSGAAKQIRLEKRTYLVTTIVKFVLALELLSLILFVINADQMAVMFTGAMCAVGTLRNNAFGFPALLLKVAIFFAAIIWLLLNSADEQGRDYPLTRPKYMLLMGLSPIVVAAAVVQFLYFYNLQTDVITSCCSKLYTPENGGLQADLSALSPGVALGALLGGFAFVGVFACWLREREALRFLYGPAALGFFLVSITTIISVISSYVYEQPHHHCPFCILKWQYYYVGFALYIPLFLGTGFGMAAGLMGAFKTPASLRAIYPQLTHRNIVLSLIFFAVFMLVTLLTIWRSHLILFG